MRRWLLLIPLILLILALGFVIWALAGPGAMDEAQAALISDSAVVVDADGALIFQPADGDPRTGLIIYPGGRVDPAAYAPLARAIAAQGYLVAIVPMPLNLAVLGPNRALDVIESFPEISTWAVAGHSLGGAMAANFVAGHPGSVDALALWAAYPAASDDLSDQELVVSSVYGTRDGVALLEDIRASEALLPPDTRWTAIEGGNHSQFGWYGFQSGDNPAEISREVQQAQIVQATLEMLEAISSGR
jgi:dienelactone hydrolase